MMKQIIIATLLVASMGTSMSAQAQIVRPRPYPGSGNVWQSREFRDQLGQLLDRTKSDADRFRNSFNDAIDRSRSYSSRPYNNNRERNDQLKQFVNDFRDQVRRVRDRFKNGDSIQYDMQQLLDNRRQIDGFMQRRNLTGNAESDWAALNSDLDQLEQIYNRADRFRRF